MKFIYFTLSILLISSGFVNSNRNRNKLFTKTNSNLESLMKINENNREKSLFSNSIAENQNSRSTISLSDLDSLSNTSNLEQQGMPTVELSSKDIQSIPDIDESIKQSANQNNEINENSPHLTTINMDEINKLSEINESIDTAESNKSVINQSKTENLPKAAQNNPLPEMKTIELTDINTKLQEIKNDKTKKSEYAKKREARRAAIAKKQEARREAQIKKVQQIKAEKKALAEKRSLEKKEKLQQEQQKRDLEAQQKALESLKLAKQAEDAKPYAYEANVDNIVDPERPIRLIHKNARALKKKIKITEKEILNHKKNDKLINKKVRENQEKVTQISSKIKELLNENQRLSKSLEVEGDLNSHNKKKITNFIQKYDSKIKLLDDKLTLDKEVITKGKEEESMLRTVLQKFLKQFVDLNKTVESFKDELNDMVLILK